MDIGVVVRVLKIKEGAKFKRASWADDHWIEMPHKKIMVHEGDYSGEWVTTQERILADNWEEVVVTDDVQYQEQKKQHTKLTVTN
jgi:hypothetical protein